MVTGGSTKASVLKGQLVSNNDRKKVGVKKQGANHAVLAQAIPSHSHAGVCTNGRPFGGGKIGNAYKKP